MKFYLDVAQNLDCSHKAGMIHKECLRPIDRILGIAKIPNIDKHDYLKNFDVALWIKLLLNGRQVGEI